MFSFPYFDTHSQHPNSSLMLEKRRHWSLLCVLAITVFTTHLLAKPKGGNIQRPQEMELDARVIKGQKAEGAVYLFQRVQRPLPSLLNFKRNELKAIVLPVFNQNSVLGQQFLQHTSHEKNAIAAQKNQKQSDQTQIKSSKTSSKSKKRRKRSRKSKWSRKKKRSRRSKR